jgi:hypothetical protein
VKVGAALWKDRRVSVSTKAWSAAAGLLMMAATVAADYLLAMWIFGPKALESFSASSIIVAGGWLLFSTIALLRLAPAGAVNLARLQRAGAIPLRSRNR